MIILKKHGILNSHITKVLTDLGHTDQLTIGDCGLPIPADVNKIDLAITLKNPSFIDVLEAILTDMQVEKVILAAEIKEHNKKLSNQLSEKFRDIEIEYVSHEVFKEQTHMSKAFIRTGEATPYANIILQSGVIF